MYLSQSVMDYFLFLMLAIALPIVVLYFATPMYLLIDERRISSFARRYYHDNKRRIPWYIESTPSQHLRVRWHYDASTSVSICLLSFTLLWSVAALTVSEAKEKSLAYEVFANRASSVDLTVLIFSSLGIAFLLFKCIKPFAYSNIKLSRESMMKSSFLALSSVIAPLYYYAFFHLPWV